LIKDLFASLEGKRCEEFGREKKRASGSGRKRNDIERERLWGSFFFS